MPVKKNHVDSEGFMDVPAIIEAGETDKIFPGLLPEELKKCEFPQYGEQGQFYLDDTATTPEPRSILDKSNNYKKGEPYDKTGRIHLIASDHSKNYRAAIAMERDKLEAKAAVKDFFNAHNFKVAMSFNTSHASNMVGCGYDYKPGDLLIMQRDNHHSQICTPRRFARRAGAEVAYVPISYPDGRLDLDYLNDLVKSKKHGKGRVIMFATHVSNISGVIHPIDKISDILRSHLGDRAFIYDDIAQAGGHICLDLDSLDIDAAGFSAHKGYGPKGVGALFIKKGREDLISYGLCGGGAVEAVDEFEEVLAPSPQRFEIGTQNLEGFVEWSFVLDWLKNIGMENIEKHDEALGKYMLGELVKLQDKGLIELYGPRVYDAKVPVFAYNFGNWRHMNHEQGAKMLDEMLNVGNRNGCFCAHIGLSDLMDVPYDIRNKYMDWTKEGKNLAKKPGAIRSSVGVNHNILDAYTQINAIRTVGRKLQKDY